MSTLSHPIIILIRGLPGSGKSHLTQPLCGAIEALTHEPAIVLDPDATDHNSQAYKEHIERLTQEGVDTKLHAYRFLRGQAYSGIANRDIVLWNQPFTNREIFNKMVARFYEHAETVGTKPEIVVVEVEVDSEIAKQRVVNRKEQGGHGPSDATFERFVNDYTSFAHEGYNTVTVHGQDAVEKSIAIIMAKLQPIIESAQTK